jgi:choline dehydrogenase
MLSREWAATISSGNLEIYAESSDFSDWVKAGATGWDAAEMARYASLLSIPRLLKPHRYFTKAEKYSPNPDFPDIDTTLHGSSGLASTRYGPFAVCTLSYYYFQ